MRWMNRIVPAVGVIVLCGSGLVGCTWVDLTTEGEQVQVLPPDATAACERLGVTRARTKTAVGPFSRKETKVVEEQTALARNGAARMGGNAISVDGPPEDGEQAFGVYRCSVDAS
jgi:hypothetical protein